MNWDAVGAVGEIIGATAVLLSLLYLGFQIRQNTKSLKSSSYQAAIASMSESSNIIASNEQSARICRTMLFGDTQDLSEDESFMGSAWLTGLFRNYENFYYQHQTGAMEDHLWEGMRRTMVGYYNLPNIGEWWAVRKGIYSTEFSAFLESQENDPEFKLTVVPPHSKHDA